jgi:hypothetical protein
VREREKEKELWGELSGKRKEIVVNVVVIMRNIVPE